MDAEILFYLAATQKWSAFYLSKGIYLEKAFMEYTFESALCKIKKKKSFAFLKIKRWVEEVFLQQAVPRNKQVLVCEEI